MGRTADVRCQRLTSSSADQNLGLGSHVWPRARLFFEVYGQALRGGCGSELFLKDVVSY